MKDRECISDGCQMAGKRSICEDCLYERCCYGYTDEDLDKHAVHVQNGDGYYEEFGDFRWYYPED